MPLALAAASSCSEAVDFKKTLEVTDVSGGWFDAGIVDGKNKLVPSVSFRIRKPADVRLRSLSLNIHFKKIVDPSKPGLDGEEEADEVFLQTVEFADGHANGDLAGASTDGCHRRRATDAGRDAPEQPFQDMRARVFAKESSTKWVELLTFDIPRVVLTK